MQVKIEVDKYCLSVARIPGEKSDDFEAWVYLIENMLTLMFERANIALYIGYPHSKCIFDDVEGEVLRYRVGSDRSAFKLINSCSRSFLADIAEDGEFLSRSLWIISELEGVNIFDVKFQRKLSRLPDLYYAGTLTESDWPEHIKLVNVDNHGSALCLYCRDHVFSQNAITKIQELLLKLNGANE
ncbi:MAG: hypothetical protein KF744_04690 [Taibaiella sp.]|nr:hypothetical protein [Taibaiella sp.]